MATKHRVRKMTHTYKLDSKPYLDKVSQAGEVAERALGHYGEPSMSLTQLRAVLDRQIKGISLSELIIKERESGW